MKFLKMVFPFLLCLLSCYDPALEEPIPEVEDPDCISMTGERFEKYYLEIDASFLENEITLISPNVLGYEYDNETDPVFYAFNQISLHNIPIEQFYDNSPFEAEVTGAIAVSANQSNIHIAYSLPFNTTIQASPERDFSREPFAVLNSFTNTPGDLILPYTGIYSTGYQLEDFVTFSVAIPSDLLKSLQTQETFTIPYGPSEALTEFTVDGVFPCDLVCQAEEYVLLAPKSRNFYQYENLTATFAPGVLVSNLRPNESIVKSCNYDPDKNSISVTFFEYDYPYTGDVLSYSIQNEDGSLVEKTIRVEG